MKKPFLPNLLLFCAATILLAATQASAQPSKPCTAEAKICPDGTTVGRTGPNCEFSPCPGGPDAFGEAPEGNSGIKGIATVGPTCPAISSDPKEAEHCKDHPFQGTLIIREGKTLREASRVQTDPDGRFEVTLPPGHYSIITEGDTMFPRCRAEVDVKPGEFVNLAVSCDTGIR